MNLAKILVVKHLNQQVRVQTHKIITMFFLSVVECNI